MGFIKPLAALLLLSPASSRPLFGLGLRHSNADADTEPTFSCKATLRPHIRIRKTLHALGTALSVDCDYGVAARTSSLPPLEPAQCLPPSRRRATQRCDPRVALA